MTATLTIDEPAFLNSIMAEFQKVKVPCQAAMAEAFRSVVDGNLGDKDFKDIPHDWDGLSSKYAKRIGRAYPTLRMNGVEAAIMGAEPNLLYDSTRIEVTNPDFATVYNDCEYASAHQFGEGNMPPRPFFPISGNEVLPYTTQKCLDACEAELERKLR